METQISTLEKLGMTSHQGGDENLHPPLPNQEMCEGGGPGKEFSSFGQKLVT